MQVKLLTYTPDCERVVAVGAKTCYSSDDPATLWQTMSDEQVDKMIAHLLTSQHTSPIEHAYFTFGIQGLSRAAAQQLTRHRLMSVSMQSQRYVDMNNANYTVPGSIMEAKPIILSNETPKKVFFKFLEATNNTYRYLTKNCGIKKEDARAILPLCTQSNLVITLNAAELYHIFDLRCCVRAQREFRELAGLMLKLVKEAAPNLFAKAGASCVHYGYCPEGSQSCGKAPTLETLLETYKDKKED